jgi:hypothetical protein
MHSQRVARTGSSSVATLERRVHFSPMRRVLRFALQASTSSVQVSFRRRRSLVVSLRLAQMLG